MFMKIGVYRRNISPIERTILSINKNAKNHLRKEVFEYIRINKTIQDIDINEQFINFKNGMYDLINNRLIEHSPTIFTTCQVHANYVEDLESISNKYVERFLDDITCYNEMRKITLLQIIGYAMTYKVDLQKAFIFYGPSARNGKSTTIDMINALIGKENICHVSLHQLRRKICWLGFC